ncbi:uncharacterized protein [Solanum lycopersicum]|uniref:uncharacterized protein n=1 Tax=Solanum lycopersicum TaxID=4081 RepID=UPI00374A5E79
MRLITSEEAELETYQLNDVAQAWYVKWRDNRPLRGEPVTSEIFKKDFIYMLFPRDNREANVVEFINLREGGRMSLCLLHENMNISRLMVHAQQVEETRAERNSREAQRARSFDGCSSKGRPDIKDKQTFKKSFSNQVPSKFSNCRDDKAIVLVVEKSGPKVRDFPNMKGQEKGSGQYQANGSNDAPKKNHFYALR